MQMVKRYVEGLPSFTLIQTWIVRNKKRDNAVKHGGWNFLFDPSSSKIFSCLQLFSQ